MKAWRHERWSTWPRWRRRRRVMTLKTICIKHDSFLNGFNLRPPFYMITPSINDLRLCCSSQDPFCSHRLVTSMSQPSL